MGEGVCVKVCVAAFLYAWVRVCECECVSVRACMRARSWLGHPALFNVTLTSKPCVQALNADRMERVFI